MSRTCCFNRNNHIIIAAGEKQMNASFSAEKAVCRLKQKTAAAVMHGCGSDHGLRQRETFFNNSL